MSHGTQAPHGVNRHLHTRNPLALLLRAVALVLIGVAVSLNYTHTTDATGSLALAIGAAALGILGPAALHGAFEASTIAQRVVAVLVGLVCLGVCLLTSIASSVTLRGDGAAARAALIEQRGTIAERRKAMDAELSKLGTPRTVAQIDADLVAVPIDAVIWARSKKCLDISLPDSRRACEPASRLYREKAASERAAELRPLLDALDAQLASLRSAAEADGQAAGLAWLLKRIGVAVDTSDVARFTAIFFGVALEIGAAGSLIVAGMFDGRREAVALPVEVAAPVVIAASVPQPIIVAAPAQRPVRAAASATDEAIIAHVRANGGRVVTSHRALADAINRPASSVSESLRRLAAAGVLVNAGGAVEMVSKWRVVA